MGVSVKMFAAERAAGATLLPVAETVRVVDMLTPEMSDHLV